MLLDCFLSKNVIEENFFLHICIDSTSLAFLSCKESPNNFLDLLFRYVAFFLDLFLSPFSPFPHSFFFCLPLLDSFPPTGVKLWCPYRIQNYFKLGFSLSVQVIVISLPAPLSNPSIPPPPIVNSLLVSGSGQAKLSRRHLFPTWPPLKLCSWQFLHRTTAPMCYLR